MEESAVEEFPMMNISMGVRSVHRHEADHELFHSDSEYFQSTVLSGKKSISWSGGRPAALKRSIVLFQSTRAASMLLCEFVVSIPGTALNSICVLGLVEYRAMGAETMQAADSMATSAPEIKCCARSLMLILARSSGIISTTSPSPVGE